MQDEIQVKVHSYGPGRFLALVYFDPVSGKKKAKSSGTTDWREAERLAGELEKQLRSGQYVSPSKITWAEFRKRYEAERLAMFSPTGRDSARVALNHVERVLNLDRLARLTTAAMSRFAGELRKAGMKDSTLACHLRHLGAALRWAHKMGLLGTVPSFDMPKAGEAKGRPIATEEFERMLAVVPKVRPRDAMIWERFLTGLWLSGLRLGEGVILSWEPDAPFAVDLSGKYPAFRIEAKAQKGRRDERLPMTPDFAQWLVATFPKDERVGRVFKLPTFYAKGHRLVDSIGQVIVAIGEKAGVVVKRDPDTGKVKYASAHDLRRSYACRWAPRVKTVVLQRLMRHRNIATTLKYYAALEADEVAADLWGMYHGVGNIPGNTAPENPCFSRQ